MASQCEECLPQVPSSSSNCFQLQKQRLCLRAERRMRNVCPSPYPDSPVPELKGDGEIRATVSSDGTEIVVAEPNHAIRLYAMGNFGTFVGQRMNFANWHCFLSADSAAKPEQEMEEGSEPSEQRAQHSLDTRGQAEKGGKSKKKAKESAAEWIGKTTGGGGLLHLSPEEALYLSYDLKVLTLATQQDDMPTEYSPEQFFANLCALRPNFASIFYRYIVYRYFRRLGWVVRGGISFGVDFLLYKCSVDAYHSSAGVRIVHSAKPIATDNSIGALQRELANCKKRLLLANVVGLPDKPKNLCLQQLEMATVQVLSMSVWSVNKNRISDLNGQK